jgi:hypothetical protein
LRNDGYYSIFEQGAQFLRPLFMYKDSQIIVVIDFLSSSQRCGSGSGIGGTGVFLTPRSGIRERFFLEPGSPTIIFESIVTNV